MFNFVVRYLGFLKHVPGAGLLFDAWLKIITLVTQPELLDWMDEIENEVLRWEGVTKSIHKYGGVQFNYHRKEIGHIHGNGLLDMLLSRKLKQELMGEGMVLDHHVFKQTGWISFNITTKTDAQYALRLLRMGHHLKQQRTSLSPGRDHQAALPPIVTVLA